MALRVGYHGSGARVLDRHGPGIPVVPGSAGHLWGQVESGQLDENEHVIILLTSRRFEKRGNLVGLYYVGEILENGNSN